MLVTPIKRKFGKHQPGDVFELRDKTAQVLIKVGKLAEATRSSETVVPVSHSQRYMTRDMTSEVFSGLSPEMQDLVNEVAEAAKDIETIEIDCPEAPWGYKADGTPRKRPGRAPSSE